MVFLPKNLFIIILSVILFLGVPIESFAQEKNKDNRPNVSYATKTKVQKEKKNNKNNKNNEKKTTQVLEATNNEGGDEFNGSVLTPSEDEINILMNTLLNVMKKGNLSDVKVILKSIYNSTSSFKVPKEAISIQKKRIKKKDRTYLVVNIFNLKTASEATIPPSSLPTDTYELIFTTEDGEYSTNQIKYFTPTLIVGTVKSKTQGLVTVEDLDGKQISEKTVVVNPNGTFFTEVRANKLLAGTKIRKNKTSTSVSNQGTGNEQEVTSEAGNSVTTEDITTGVVRVVADKDLLAITQLKNDPKLNAKKSEKTIVVDDVSTITANIAKSNDKALAKKIAEEQIKDLESEKQKQFGDDIGCEIDKFAEGCISNDEATLTEIGADFRDFVKNNTCNFPEYGLIKEFILASPEDINLFIGQGYCEFFKGEANDDKPCEAYTDILNDFRQGLISELPCPPPFCEEFQNIRPPKCVESQVFCEDDGSSVDPGPEPFLFKLERVCRGPECIEETNECIPKVEKDHFCEIIGEEVDFEECEGDPSWQIAFDTENVGYCIPSDITSEQGIGETVSHCQTIACHNRCEEEFRFNTPLNFTPFNEELNEIQQCHFNCDIEGGLTYTCEDEFSEFFSSKCCGPEEIIRRPVGGIRKPISPDVRSCLCKNPDNFNVKNALVNPEAIEACKNYCPDGYKYDEINNLCLPICSQGSFRNPDGTCRSNCPRGLIQDEFGSCSCPEGKYLNEFGRCTDGSCPEYCKHITSSSNYYLPEECKSCIDSGCPAGFQKDPASGICISSASCGSNMLPNNVPGEASCICPQGLPYWDSTSYQCVASCPNGPPPASNSTGLLPKSPIPCNAGGSQCPAATPYRCSDGTCATSYSVCPYSCPVSYPYKCPDGTCVVSSTDCPYSCPAGYPYKCSDGTCATSSTTCPSSCPPATPYRCGDGTCATSYSACPSVCSASYPYKCPDGTCATSAASCTTCPGATPHRCPDGTCVVSATSCPYSCPAGYPYKCSDGTCVTSLAYCPTSCPPATPYRCGDGTCAVSSTTCTSSCPPATPYHCHDGTCAVSATTCSSSCPHATPYKCADGTCATSSTTCPSQGTITFTKAALGSTGLTVTFTINFTDGACAYFYDKNNVNFYSLCSSGTDVLIPPGSTSTLLVGDLIKICKSNNPTFCSTSLAITASSTTRTCGAGEGPNILPSNPCSCESRGGTTVNASGYCQCPNSAVSYTAIGCRACASGEVYSSSNPCACAGTATYNAQNICSCPSGGTYSESGCTLPPTITLSSVTISGSNVTISHSVNPYACLLVKDTNNNTLKLANICGSGSFNSVFPAVDFTPSLQTGTQVKLCNQNDSNNCSSLVTVTSSVTCTLPKVLDSATNTCVCPQGRSPDSVVGCTCPSSQVDDGTGCVPGQFTLTGAVKSGSSVTFTFSKNFPQICYSLKGPAGNQPSSFCQVSGSPISVTVLGQETSVQLCSTNWSNVCTNFVTVTGN